MRESGVSISFISVLEQEDPSLHDCAAHLLQLAESTLKPTRLM